jgi:hypothetical protein
MLCGRGMAVVERTYAQSLRDVMRLDPPRAQWRSTDRGYIVPPLRGLKTHHAVAGTNMF